MALITQWDLSQDVTYQNRVKVAVYTAISAVAQESTSGVNSEDLRRNQLVQKYIEDLDGAQGLIHQLFINLSIINPLIATASTNPDPNSVINDGDIQFVINSLFNTVAGVNENNSNL